jgi:hypothetical protein
MRASAHPGLETLKLQQTTLATKLFEKMSPLLPCRAWPRDADGRSSTRLPARLSNMLIVT